MPQAPRVIAKLPRSVWVLGIVSLLTDISSEMVSGLLPVFLIGVMGVNASWVGLLEGLAGASTMLVKIFSGALSDYFGKRRPFLITGYALSACAKPMLALASSFALIAFSRGIDRIGKGVRDAPRDALIADITEESHRGAAFGLRQTLDTIGAFVGPLLAMGLMLLWSNDYRAVFWVACVPAFLALLLLAWHIQEPQHSSTPKPIKLLHPHTFQALDASYWWLVGIGATLTLARFSDAFLILRAQQNGLPLALTPLVLIAMNTVYAAFAYPFGQLSDRINPKLLLTASLLTLITADVFLSLGGTPIWIGIMLWGLQMAMSQGLLSAMVAATAPAHLRGTAFGVFNLVTGIALLLSSTLAGVLWDQFGAAIPFIASGLFCGVALALVGISPPLKSNT